MDRPSEGIHPLIFQNIKMEFPSPMEKIYTDLIAALNRHSDALDGFVKSAGKGATAGASAGAKPAGAAAGAAAGTKPKPKPTGPTLETMQERFGAYMAIQDKTVRAQRKDHVLAIAGHFNADRATNIAAEHRQAALDMLDVYEAGKDPFATEEDGDEDGGEGDSVI